MSICVCVCAHVCFHARWITMDSTAFSKCYLWTMMQKCISWESFFDQFCQAFSGLSLLCLFVDWCIVLWQRHGWPVKSKWCNALLCRWRQNEWRHQLCRLAWKVQTPPPPSLSLSPCCLSHLYRISGRIFLGRSAFIKIHKNVSFLPVIIILHHWDNFKFIIIISWITLCACSLQKCLFFWFLGVL